MYILTRMYVCNLRTMYIICLYMGQCTVCLYWSMYICIDKRQACSIKLSSSFWRRHSLQSCCRGRKWRIENYWGRARDGRFKLSLITRGLCILPGREIKVTVAAVAAERSLASLLKPIWVQEGSLSAYHGLHTLLCWLSETCSQSNNPWILLYLYKREV